MCVIDTSRMKDGEVEIIMIYKDLDGGEKKERNRIIFNMINTAAERKRKEEDGIFPLPVTTLCSPAILLSRKSLPAEGYETVITVR